MWKISLVMMILHTSPSPHFERKQVDSVGLYHTLSQCQVEARSMEWTRRFVSGEVKSMSVVAECYRAP